MIKEYFVWKSDEFQVTSLFDGQIFENIVYKNNGGAYQQGNVLHGYFSIDMAQHSVCGLYFRDTMSYQNHVICSKATFGSTFLTNPVSFVLTRRVIIIIC